MKTIKALLMALLLCPAIVLSQSLDNLDYVSPFHEGLAAVKKGDNWAFINKQGEMVIGFRNDLEPVKESSVNYPYFSDGRSIISVEKEGVNYFGFIDASGKTIIQPEYLNTTPFNNGKAIALKLTKELLGTNDALDKKMLNYTYIEVVLDVKGDVIGYLSEPTHITLDRKYVRKPPEITTTLLTDNLYVKRQNDNRLTIKPIHEKSKQ